MTVEIGMWRLDQGTQAVHFDKMATESKLEDILAANIDMVAPHLMVIGRQVRTSFDKFVDLLAVDIEGNLTVLELKRDKTPRDIVAQALDYGSWVRDLNDEDIARIFQDYQKKHGDDKRSLNQAFCERFQTKSMPEELNGAHELLIVASSLDPSTERIIDYLAEEYGVQINGAFFRFFKDGDREYLTRAWLRSPVDNLIEPKGEQTKGEWNGEYYVSFGHDEVRDWGEARKYGFISAGGGTWYTNTLSQLQPGARVWVNVPGRGYVGVGIVKHERIPVDEFEIMVDGSPTKVVETDAKLAAAPTAEIDPELAEYVVPVEWLHTIDLDNPISERGFFGNQNTVAKPRAPKWEFTISRLRIAFNVEAEQ